MKSQLIPPQIVKELVDKANLLKMQAVLMAMHKVLLGKIDQLEKRSPNIGQAELTKAIQPMIDKLGLELKTIVSYQPTPKVPSIDEIVLALTPHLPKARNGKDAQIDYDLLAQKIAPLMKQEPIKIPHEQLLEAIKEKIKPEHIKGLGVYMDGRIRPYMSGGGDTVGAGTNVTITEVNGRKVISANGITTLTSTETPNGSITVFTFAGATAQPSYLLVDNIWMRAVTKSGTVNWTWDNTNKQATLTIPPTDEILAMV